MKTNVGNADFANQIRFFFDTMSPQLKEEVIKFILNTAIDLNINLASKKVGADSNLEFRRQLVCNAELMLCKPEETLITQDDKADDLYVISSGDCEVFVKDWTHKDNKELYVRTLYQGMYFGEIALMNNTVRSATVKSYNFCVIGRIAGSHFHNILYKFPDMRKTLIKNMQLYQDQLKVWHKSLI